MQQSELWRHILRLTMAPNVVTPFLQRIYLLLALNLNFACIYFHFLDTRQYVPFSRNSTRNVRTYRCHGLSLLVPYRHTYGTVPAHFWYRTGTLVVPYQHTCGTIPAHFWYRTGTHMVPYRHTCTVPAHLWCHTSTLVVPYRHTSGTVPAHL